MADLIFTICVLGVVIVGMLVMMQVLSLEQVGCGIWRGVISLALAFIAVWLLRSVLLPILQCWLVWLKGVMLWALLIVLVGIAAVFLVRLLYMRLGSPALPGKNKNGGNEL